MDEDIQHRILSVRYKIKRSARKVDLMKIRLRKVNDDLKAETKKLEEFCERLNMYNQLLRMTSIQERNTALDQFFRTKACDSEQQQLQNSTN